MPVYLTRSPKQPGGLFRVELKTQKTDCREGEKDPKGKVKSPRIKLGIWRLEKLQRDVVGMYESLEAGS